MTQCVVSLEQLQVIMPNSKARASVFLEPLNTAMREFGIDTPLRIASTLSQIAVESGELRYTSELATGITYEFRSDLGNTQRGDGRKYKGQGLIQITGKNNFIALMIALNIDCVEHPEIVAEPVNACRSACWFLATHDCFKWMDVGNNQAVSGIVNTGSPTRAPEKINGLKERMKYYQVAKNVLGIT